MECGARSRRKRHRSDLGKVIGRQGRTAKAIRTILNAVGLVLAMVKAEAVELAVSALISMFPTPTVPQPDI